MTRRLVLVLLLLGTVISGSASPHPASPEAAPAGSSSAGTVPEKLSGYFQVIDEGRIDWSGLSASAWGKTLKVVLNPGGNRWKIRARAEAGRDARRKLYPVLSELPVRSDARLQDRPEWVAGMRNFLPTLPAAAERASRDNFFEIRIDAPLYGPDGLGTAIRPREGSVEEPPPGTGLRPAAAGEGPTAVVLDARGTGAVPVLWPRILDEDGKLLLDYGPGPEAAASPLAAVGYYWADSAARAASPPPRDPAGYRSLMGSRPLVLRPIRAQGERAGDLVLSRAGAAELAGHERAMELARKEGLFIILDPPPRASGSAIKKPPSRRPAKPRRPAAHPKIPEDGP